jgi:hypothetical protein
VLLANAAHLMSLAERGGERELATRTGSSRQLWVGWLFLLLESFFAPTSKRPLATSRDFVRSCHRQKDSLTKPRSISVRFSSAAVRFVRSMLKRRTDSLAWRGARILSQDFARESRWVSKGLPPQGEHSTWWGGPHLLQYYRYYQRKLSGTPLL